MSRMARPTRAVGFIFLLAASSALGATYTVTNPNDSGPGSLRQAILDANASAVSSMITFNIGGGGAQTISLLSALPRVTVPVNIDGTTQPPASGTPRIAIQYASAGTESVLELAGSNSYMYSLSISVSGSGTGILLTGSGNSINS